MLFLKIFFKVILILIMILIAMQVPSSWFLHRRYSDFLTLRATLIKVIIIFTLIVIFIIVIIMILS